MSESPEGLGLFGAIIWPTYVGAATDDPGAGPVPDHEPIDDTHYERGQITWETQEDGEVRGRAAVHAPQGRYTYVVFCHGPRELMVGKTKLAQPITLDRPGVIPFDPIDNQNLRPTP